MSRNKQKHRQGHSQNNQDVPAAPPAPSTSKRQKVGPLPLSTMHFSDTPAPVQDPFPTADPITLDDDYMIALRALINTADILAKRGYVTELLTDDDLLRKRRCAGCGKTMSKLSIPCKFHPGKVVTKHWTCCSQHVSAPPCSSPPTHMARTYAPGTLTELYQFHPTPAVSSGAEMRAAVAMDCEMGTAQSGDSELIRISLVDFFSGAVLVDNLVQPDVPMKTLNTKYSGVTWEGMRRAQREGKCLPGTAAARRAVWRFVGPQTVVVGHGASSDFRALRWIHASVVDSYVVEYGRMERTREQQDLAEYTNDLSAIPIPTGDDAAQAKPKRKKGTGDLALRTLVKRYVNRDIQMGGRKGHDSLEDAMGARDVVHFLLANPDSA